VIVEDVQRAGETLKREAMAREQAVVVEQERKRIGPCQADFDTLGECDDGFLCG
jgi:hypothetical protein